MGEEQNNSTNLKHEEEADRVRAGAKVIAEDTLRSRTYLIEQFAGMSRWIIASLLAVHSGALIAVLNIESLSLAGKQAGGALFAVGLCAALLSAYANIRSIKAILPQMTAQQEYWSRVAITGEHNEAEEEEFVVDWSKGRLAERAAGGFGWLSFALFAIALIVCGFALTESVDRSPQIGAVTCQMSDE